MIKNICEAIINIATLALGSKINIITLALDSKQ